MAQETDYTTITVPKQVKDDLDEHRGDRPWGSYLEQLRREHADPITINDVQELADLLTDELDVSANDGVSTDKVAEQIAERVAQHQSGPDVEAIVEQLKNEISMANEPGVEVDTEGIIKRIDDLESQLPPKIAEELR